MSVSETEGSVAVGMQERTELFTQDLAQHRIEDPAPGRHTLWVRLGVAGMVIGLLVCAGAYARSAGSVDPLVQRDSLALGLVGVALTIVGAAVYLRYSITKVLRFWLARLSFDLQDPGEPPTG